MRIEVYTDGSATTSDKPGGWAYVLLVDGAKHSEGSGYMENASNNDAELEAALQGLGAAYEFLRTPQVEILLSSFEHSIIPPKVTLVADSQLILGWVTGKYTFRQQDKMDKFKQLQLFVNLLDVDTRWVEGHTGQEHNERCDTLANQARLNVQSKADKAEAILKGNTLIGTKKNGTVCLFYKNMLKVIDLDKNVVEDYNREIHGNRGSMLEIREEKSR